MKAKEISVNYLGGCYEAPSANDLFTLPSAEELKGEDMRGELKHVGPWHIPVSYKALAMSCDFGEFSKPENVKLYGMRTLTNVRECGHELEGRVKVNGKRYRGFTSSALFQRADGSLVSVATIHVCIPKQEAK